MRNLSPATSAYFQSRAGMVARALVWIKARDRVTGEDRAVGLWNGDDHQSFEINAAARLYYGAGSVLKVPQITLTSGLVVQMQQLELSSLTPEAAVLLRAYDLRLAPVEIHRALFSPTTMELVDTPVRMFKGWVDEAPIPTGPIDAEVSVTLTLASSARELTRTLALKKSDATQRLRADDRFRRYTVVTGEIDVLWGDG
jgi:hypothetical protein